jgi:hypothetical protein
MNLAEWAMRWQLPPQAVEELRMVLGGPAHSTGTGETGVSESAVQQRLRLHGSARGLRLWRNNRGALPDARGVPVRYGLANESKAMDKKIKSHDLIGIRAVHITPQHVGRVIGQFVSFEAKPEGWRYAGTEREEAQLAWGNLISSYGGMAGFAQAEVDIDNLLTRF